MRVDASVVVKTDFRFPVPLLFFAQITRLMKQLLPTLLLSLAWSGIFPMIWGTPTMADSLAKTRAMSAPTIVEVFIEKDSIRMELEDRARLI